MFKRVLVPIDMSSPEAGARSCPRAREMVDAWNVEVQLLTILPGYTMPLVASYFPQGAIEEMQIRVKGELETLAKKYFDTVPEVKVRTGKRASEILSEAADWKADLIIFGCRPKDVLGGELILGSCGVRVAERAHCNVLIAR